MRAQKGGRAEDLSAAAAGEDEKSDEKEPDIVVLEKMAKAVVHKFSYPLARGRNFCKFKRQMTLPL